MIMVMAMAGTKGMIMNMIGTRGNVAGLLIGDMCIELFVRPPPLFLNPLYCHAKNAKIVVANETFCV